MRGARFSILMNYWSAEHPLRKQQTAWETGNAVDRAIVQRYLSDPDDRFRRLAKALIDLINGVASADPVAESMKAERNRQILLSKLVT